MMYRVDYFVNGKKFEREFNIFVEAMKAALNYKRCFTNRVFVLTYEGGKLTDIEYVD